MRRLQIVFALSLGLSAPAFGQSSDPAWLDELSSQAESREQCKVVYFMRFQEGELGGKKTYEARLQCEDGRQFDAQRIGDTEPFTFKACEIQVC